MPRLRAPCALTRLLPALLLVSTGGCASTSSGSGGATLIPSSGGGELQIRDYVETYLPREVYLAKFEIVPEMGASLLFPTKAEEAAPLGPGTHRLPNVPTAFVHAQRERYVSRITGLLNQAPPPVTSATVLVVTSSQPLALDVFMRAPSGLRDRLGPRAYVNEILAVEQILATVIGDPAKAVAEHRTQTVSIPSAWSIRR